MRYGENLSSVLLRLKSNGRKIKLIILAIIIMSGHVFSGSSTFLSAHHHGWRATSQPKRFSTSFWKILSFQAMAFDLCCRWDHRMGLWGREGEPPAPSVRGSKNPVNHRRLWSSVRIVVGVNCVSPPHPKRAETLPPWSFGVSTCLGCCWKSRSLTFNRPSKTSWPGGGGTLGTSGGLTLASGACCWSF